MLTALAMQKCRRRIGLIIAGVLLVSRSQ